MIKGGFCLVETLFDVHCELPVDIGDGIRIQRPSAAQSEIIAAIDDDALAYFISRIDLKRFTHDNVEVSDSAASANSWNSVLLPKSQQRFLVWF